MNFLSYKSDFVYTFVYIKGKGKILSPDWSHSLPEGIFVPIFCGSLQISHSHVSFYLIFTAHIQCTHTRACVHVVMYSWRGVRSTETHILFAPLYGLNAWNSEMWACFLRALQLVSSITTTNACFLFRPSHRFIMERLSLSEDSREYSMLRLKVNKGSLGGVISRSEQLITLQLRA